MSEGRHLLHLRFALTAGHVPELLEQLRRVLEDFTPRVQMLEPDSAVGGLSLQRQQLDCWRCSADGQEADTQRR